MFQEMESVNSGIVQYMKCFKIVLVTLIVLNSCGEKSNNINLPNQLFESYIKSKIPTDVRIFDGKSVIVDSGERTIWIAFDSSESFWKECLSSMKLEEVGYQLNVPGRNVADTGFEGYIDGDFKTYRNTKENEGVFFIRRMNDGNLRIVFLYRET